MSNALVPFADLDRMATAIASSKLFGTATKEQALALMLVAQAEGLHPATAARDYHIIEGRPALKADAMLARYLNSGGKVEWHEHTDDKVAATFTHQQGGTLRIEWDTARATKAKLTTKVNRDGSPNMWTKYPRQMLRARVISEGVRATNPAVAIGLYTPEEVRDMDDDKPKRARKEKDMGPVVPAEEEPQTDDRPKVVAEQIEAIHTALSECGVELNAFLAKAEIGDLRELAAEDAPKGIEWIRKQKKKSAAAI